MRARKKKIRKAGKKVEQIISFCVKAQSPKKPTKETSAKKNKPTMPQLALKELGIERKLIKPRAEAQREG